MESVNAKPIDCQRTERNPHKEPGESAHCTGGTRFRLSVGAAVQSSYFYVPRHSVPTSATKTLLYVVQSLKPVRYSALTVSGLRDMDAVGSPAQCCRDIGRQPHETVTLVVKQMLVVCGTMSCLVAAEPQLRSANRLKPLELLHDAK